MTLFAPMHLYVSHRALITIHQLFHVWSPARTPTPRAWNEANLQCVWGESNKHGFNEHIQLLCQLPSPARHQRMLLNPEKGHANIWELRNYVLMVGLRLYGLLIA